MKTFIRKWVQKFFKWLSGPEMSPEEFQKLESKKYCRKGDRYGDN